MLPDLLRRWAGCDAVYVAESGGGPALTFAEVCAAAERNARRLREVGAGTQNVAVIMANRVEAVLAYWSALFSGATVVVLDNIALGRELRRIPEQADVAWILATSRDNGVLSTDLARESGAGVLELRGDELIVLQPARRRPPRANGAEVALLVPTSGSTGSPRLVMWTHAGAEANAVAHAASLGLGAGDVSLVALPLSFSYPHVTQLLCHAWLGASIVLYPERIFLPRAFCEIAERHRATVTSLVPSLLELLRAYRHLASHDLGALRRVCFGGAPANVATVRELEARLPHVSFVHTYGLTEAGPRVTTQSDSRRLPSIGVPLAGVEVRVVRDEGTLAANGEIGELWVRSDSVMVGYYRSPDATTSAMRDGWLRTGDLARLDTSGDLHWCGRRDRVINTGGVRVAPEEIELALLEHPDIREALAYGAPDATLGEIPVALLTLHVGARITLEDVHTFLLRRLSRAKWPRRIEIRSDLPRTWTGKRRRAP